MLCQPFNLEDDQVAAVDIASGPKRRVGDEAQDPDDEQHDAEQEGVQLGRCSVAGHGLSFGSGPRVRPEANARQEASRTTPATGVASATPSATPIQCVSCSLNPECSARRRHRARVPHHVARGLGTTAAAPAVRSQTATPDYVDSPGRPREALTQCARQAECACSATARP
jgi:hypothetical protein